MVARMEWRAPRWASPATWPGTSPAPEDTILNKSDYFLLSAAFASFVLSVSLWFFVSKDAGVFVGLWVPTILSFGAYVRATTTRP